MVEKMNKKETIIKTAIKLFVEHGFENTPTSQISKEAKVATGTLFHHFKTKEELINEAYLYVKKDMREFLYNDFNPKLRIKEQTKYMWYKVIEWGFKRKVFNQFLLRFYGSTYINNLTMEQARSTFDKTKSFFKIAQKKNKIKNFPFLLFENLTVAMYQSFLTEFYERKKLDKKLLEFSFKVYWDAVSK